MHVYTPFDNQVRMVAYTQRIRKHRHNMRTVFLHIFLKIPIIPYVQIY